MKYDPIKAMLDVIAFTEGTGDNYGKIVNGTVLISPFFPELVNQKNVSITDLSRHPNILVRVKPGLTSSAAGRYQILYRTWNEIATGAKRFQPADQDAAAIALMKRRGMLDPLNAGDLRRAVTLGCKEWASFPTEKGNSYYGGQPAKTFKQIEEAYAAAIAKQTGGKNADL